MSSILDNEWKLKRVKKSHNHESYGRSKSPIHYKNKLNSHSSRSVKNSNRVVIKIYSSCKNRIGMSRHIDYITGKSDLLMTSDGLTKTAQRVFQVVLDQYQRTPMSRGFADHVNLFWFDNGIEGRDAGMSEKTFQRGLKELLEKRFLYPKDSDRNINAQRACTRTSRRIKRKKRY